MDTREIPAGDPELSGQGSQLRAEIFPCFASKHVINSPMICMGITGIINLSEQRKTKTAVNMKNDGNTAADNHQR